MDLVCARQFHSLLSRRAQQQYWMTVSGRLNPWSAAYAKLARPPPCDASSRVSMLPRRMYYQVIHNQVIQDACWINASVACADMEQCPPWKCFGLKMCVVLGAWMQSRRRRSLFCRTWYDTKLVVVVRGTHFEGYVCLLRQYMWL